MALSPDISRFLGQVRQDWKTSKDQFHKNIAPESQKPIPFFGNPETAIVATIGVNPSSGEFGPDRDWASVTTTGHWKERLLHYFRHKVPPATSLGLRGQLLA
jgi:hypothetical protein